MDVLREDDKLAWHDIGGWSCRVYASANLCEADGSKGSGWGEMWGSINSRSDEEGIDAADACCACGGGWSCRVYASANLCEADGSKGSGWGEMWGSINSRSDEEG